MDPERKAAVARGLDFLSAFFAHDERLFALGAQCVSTFYDIYLSETDTELCERARGEALQLLARLERHWLTAWPPAESWTRDHFLEVVTLARYAPAGFDPQPLLALAQVAAASSIDLRNLTLEQFGDLPFMGTADWYDTMHAAFRFEYCVHACPDCRFAASPRVGMRECFSALRRLSLEAPCQCSPHSEFGECYYLATHATYWLSAFGATQRVTACPWLYAYVRRVLEFWMRQADLRDAGTPGEDAADGLVYVDLDGVAECVDVLRGVESAERDAVCGAAASGAGDDDGDDAGLAQRQQVRAVMDGLPALLARASGWLLKWQREDGSWPPTRHARDPLRTKQFAHASDVAADALYNAMHPTWTATMALCDRPTARHDSERQRPGLAFSQRMRELMRETRFERQETAKRRTKRAQHQQR